MYLLRVNQKSQSFKFWYLEIRSAFTSRDMVFDEELMLQEKSEMEDKKRKVELQTVRQTLRKRKLSFQKALKGLKDQKRTPQIQMEANKTLLKSNLNH